jgi:excisionase family DNA binding protein
MVLVLLLLLEALTRPVGFTIDDAARQLSVGRSTVYRLIRQGTIRIVKIGSRTIVPASEIDRLLALNDGEPAA